MERYHVEVNFLGRDELPPQFKNFLLELQKIAEGEIDIVAFNKRKKEAQSLLANWIELSGGLLFSKYLFEFEEEFIKFSENLYKGIYAFEKKKSEKRLREIKINSLVFLRQINQLPPINHIFYLTLEAELKILERFFEEPNLCLEIEKPKKNHWNVAKSILGIDQEFEEKVKFEDEDILRREKDEKLFKELYVIDSNGESVPKSFTKLQIPLDPLIKQQQISLEKLFRYRKK